MLLVLMSLLVLVCVYVCYRVYLLALVGGFQMYISLFLPPSTSFHLNAVRNERYEPISAQRHTGAEQTHLCSQLYSHTHAHSAHSCTHTHTHSALSLLLIDTEGFESTGRSTAYDDRVFAASALLSSLLVYNLPGFVFLLTHLCFHTCVNMSVRTFVE
jgi:hypothetical protein